MSEALIRLVERRSGAVLAAFGAAALVAGFFAAQVRIDVSAEGVFIAGDPEISRNRSLYDEFSSTEHIVAYWELPSAFTARDLRELDGAVRSLELLDGVEEVVSLSNVEDIRSRGGDLDVSPLVHLDRIEQEIEAVRERARGHRLYENMLVSAQLDVLAVLLVPEPGLPTRVVSHELVPRVREELAGRFSRGTLHLAGYPVWTSSGDALVQSDLSRLGPVLFVVVLLGVGLAFRRAATAALVVLMVVWSELVTLAWFGWMGIPLRMITSIVPVVLIALSSTYVIYFLSLLAQESRADKPTLEALRLMTRPALLSASSTIVGFLSLRFVPLRSIGELGTALAVAIAAALLGILLLVPAVAFRRGLRLHAARPGLLDAAGRLGVRLARRPALTVAVALLGVALLVPGIARIDIASDPVRFFPVNHPLRAATDLAWTRMGGDRVMRVRVEAGEVDGALRPEQLGLLSRLQTRALDLPGVGGTLSLLDYLWLIDAALNPERPPQAVPHSRALAAQYMLLYESGGDPDDFRHYVNADRSALSLLVQLNGTSAHETLALGEALRASARETGQAEQLEVVGQPQMFSRAALELTRGLLKGLAFAAPLIFLVLCIALRSARVAAVAMVPNLLPVMVCGGAMGLLGVSLSAGTSIVACVALGLAVDDTCHVLGHLDTPGGLAAIYRRVSRPIGLTSLCLGSGFVVLALSGFESLRILGVATAGTLAVAWAADILLLPSLLVVAGFEHTEDQGGPW